MDQRYKIVILDLDGTTVASNGNALPSAAVIDRVSKAQQAGVHVALATGRPKQLAQNVYEALELQGPSVFNGGAEIYDLTSDILLHRNIIPIAALRELVTIILPFGYKVYTDGNQYNTEIKTSDDIHDVAAKLFIEAVDDFKIVPILQELSAVKGVSAHQTTSWNQGDVSDVHITHEHATKRYGVEKLLKILKIHKGDALAIGDSYNDVPLLEAAGTKIVMGNAPEEVKALADFVTSTLEEDGVAVAIDRSILN